jgi:hypothetical protein
LLGVPELPEGVRSGALGAGALLTVTGRGDLWTLAIAFGVADASTVTGLVVAAIAAATLARTGSATLADVFGSQAVLGGAGFTGSATAVACAWTSAVSLLVVARDRRTGVGLGALAGVLVAGPSFAGGARDAVVAVVAIVVGAALGWVVGAQTEIRPWTKWLALGAAAVALFFGIVAGYE